MAAGGRAPNFVLCRARFLIRNPGAAGAIFRRMMQQLIEAAQGLA
jgi:hypothetical protein